MFKIQEIKVKHVIQLCLHKKKNDSCKKQSITIKKRAIHPFLIPKKSFQMEKKNENKEPKAKNCLSRTNIRDFFVSKRINK